MGSKISSEKKEDRQKKIIHEKEKLNTYTEAPSYFMNASSSYQGMKSDYSGTSNNKDGKSEDSSLTEDSRSNKVEEKVNKESIVNKAPVTLVYKEGGGMVYVTGSFSNWGQWFLMHRQENGQFSLTLDLQIGVHYFKFIVDNVWKCSKDYPQVNDGKGNINNMIDLNTLLPAINPKIEVLKDNLETVVTQSTKEQTNSAESKKENVLLDEYSNYIPKKSDLNCEAPLVPNNYKQPFNIHTQSLQKHLGETIYFIPKQIRNFADNYSSNKSSKVIAIPPHVNLNLLYTNVHSKKRNEVLNISITHRVRNKFSTFVYYKPKTEL